MQIHKRNAFLIYTYSGRKDQICLLRKTQVYKMLHYIIIFRINLQAEREKGLMCSKQTPRFDFYFSLYIRKSPIYLAYFHWSFFENLARSCHICFGFYPFYKPPYFHSILKVKVENSRIISRLTAYVEWKILLGTTLEILFLRRGVSTYCCVIYFIK